MEIVVGISGASGVQYGIRLLQVLKEKGCITHLIMTDSAQRIIEIETNYLPGEVQKLASNVYQSDDFAAPVASGSHIFDAMVVVPCSMDSLRDCIRVLGYAYHASSRRLPQRKTQVGPGAKGDASIPNSASKHGHRRRSRSGNPARLSGLLLMSAESGRSRGRAGGPCAGFVRSGERSLSAVERKCL